MIKKKSQDKCLAQQHKCKCLKRQSTNETRYLTEFQISSVKYTMFQIGTCYEHIKWILLQIQHIMPHVMHDSFKFNSQKTDSTNICSCEAQQITERQPTFN